MTAGLRGRIGLAVLLGLLALACGIARFVFLGQFLARVFRGAPTGALVVPLLATAAAILLRAWLDHARTVIAHRTSAQVQETLRGRLYDKIVALDRRVGLCIDIGHTVRAGVDLDATVEQCADRLYEIHMKDVTAANAKGKAIQVGRGIIDIPKFLKTLIKVHYAGVVAFEYEEEADDPLPGLAESVGYTKGVLAVI